MFYNYGLLELVIIKAQQIAVIELFQVSVS